ncbi:MAG: SGNH/GDSL hydrolase family protein [Polyangiaceae bacterium]
MVATSSSAPERGAEASDATAAKRAGRRSIQRLALLSLVVALAVIVGFELLMRRARTSYSKKRAAVAARASDLEVVVMGSSCALFGIDPKELGANALNLADVSQPLYYDRKILEQWVDRLPKLRLVLLSISPLTMETTLPKGGEAWRTFLYERYWNIPPIDAQNPLDVRHFSVTALLPPPLRVKALLKFDLAPELDANGFEVERDAVVTEGMAARAYATHEPLFSEANLRENELELRGILDFLRARSVGAALVMPPVHRFYSDVYDPAVRARDLAVLRALSVEYGVPLHDHVEDTGFADEEFRDPDHLNARGASHFSKVLAADVVAPALR